MNITLKQNELEAAVRQYVGNQGISFNGRSLTSIRFSATRNPSGFIAEIVLEDKSLETGAVEIPGYTDRPAGADTGLQLVSGQTNIDPVSSAAGTAQTPVTGTIGAAIAGSTTTAAADLSTGAADTGATTGANDAEVAKTVPEETAQAAETSVETTAAPAASTTTSLFGG